MTLGFHEPDRQRSLLAEICGWELYQVQLDKFHVMFWFENGCSPIPSFRKSKKAAELVGL